VGIASDLIAAYRQAPYSNRYLPTVTVRSLVRNGPGMPLTSPALEIESPETAKNE
jgi:hypothetical protein